MAASASSFEQIKSSESTIGQAVDLLAPWRAQTRLFGSSDYDAAAGPMGNLQPARATLASMDNGNPPEVTL